MCMKRQRARDFFYYVYPLTTNDIDVVTIVFHWFILDLVEELLAEAERIVEKAPAEV